MKAKTDVALLEILVIYLLCDIKKSLSYVTVLHFVLGEGGGIKFSLIKSSMAGVGGTLPLWKGFEVSLLGGTDPVCCPLDTSSIDAVLLEVL